MNQTSSRVRPFIWRCARKTLRLCLVIYFAAAVGCAVVQRKLIYFPTTAPAAELDEFAVKYGLERWKNGVGENIGWRRKSPTQPPRGQVLITHGNGGYAMHRLNFAEPLRQSAGMDVFILEYPGYGDRAGQSSEKSFFAAAAEAFQSLPKTVPIYLMGESLGTGPACHLAGTHSNDVAGVLLLAPYNSLVDVAQHHVVILPASLILRDRFESEKYLKNYHGPLAVLVGGKDDVVPEQFGRRLFDGYTGPKKIWRAPQAGHNDIHAQSREYWGEIIAFWQTNAVRAKTAN